MVPPCGGIDVYLEKTISWFRLKGNYSAGGGAPYAHYSGILIIRSHSVPGIARSFPVIRCTFNG